MADQPSRADRLEEQFPGKYLSLTSYKRDGTAVATPVWFVIDDGRLLVMTDPESFKVKRIRRNPDVTIAPWTATGRLRGHPVPGRAELLPDSERANLDQLLARKYSWLARVLLPWIDQTLQRPRHKPAGKLTAVLADHPAAAQWARFGRHDNHLALDAAATGDRPRRWSPYPTDGLVLRRVFAP